MPHQITVGSHHFGSKKEALSFYRSILNSYEENRNLNESDKKEILDLLEFHPRKMEKVGCGVDHIKIGIPKFKTRAFELIRNDSTSTFFSFTKIINGGLSAVTRFSQACRDAVKEDIRKVKLGYFSQHSRDGKARCQESKELLKWEQLCVDHRQPNTFSVVVDRFIEVNSIDLEQIEYVTVDGGPNRLRDLDLELSFRNYHKEKANLRVVKKDLNSSRAYQGRIKRQNKDLTI